MALDSKQKRGSAIHVGIPSRQWLTEPTGTLGVTPRQSLLKFCSAVQAASSAGFQAAWARFSNVIIGVPTQ